MRLRGAPVISADRFIAQGSDRPRWMAARRGGVTATEVRDASTEGGFRDLVASWDAAPFEGNEYTDFGTWAEPQLMEHAHRAHGILPSDWVIASANDSRWLATPDGLTVDHTAIAEAKTTGKDWTKPPIKYVRQMQWQMFVTGTERCLLLWHLRDRADDGSFFMPWMEPKTLWIERDEAMIAALIETAEKVWEAKHGELQPR